MVRTLFHQLIDGVEYLHTTKVVHLDLKLQNIMLGANFNLKIIDFDLAYMHEDNVIKSKGTANFRAPELRAGAAFDLEACDIFSLGIILFLIKTRGILPFKECLESEDEDQLLVKLQKHLNKNPEKFWEIHE
eukprot:CAMPEP_0114583360 /NCGR_PEP_ID=MMETSP0125-20121206/7108_1 /TAXON_ID=485358 ORGANISM="Aristerostoma sp., Strain ATCC 50986" /NCGR_SAMPLE_ID=MMETSP0125 /ASSEMBLY_ACC=CAM_ASM_000245 /LENGTH=131 /DNA_ID=CAMNT_0001776769 /DNA_START=184 /DNA_END=579 /DNA_ORIENTATION=+